MENGETLCPAHFTGKEGNLRLNKHLPYAVPSIFTHVVESLSHLTRGHLCQEAFLGSLGLGQMILSISALSGP